MLVRQFSDAHGRALGTFGDDGGDQSLVDKIFSVASTAASDVCKIAPAGQLVAGAAGTGSVQQALQAINNICGNKPIGASTANTNPKYPSSCVARYNLTHAVYSVYCPAGVQANYGFGGAMFGDDTTVPVSPAIPAGMTKVADETTQPTGATVGPTEKDMPWYKNWKYLLPIGAGVVAVVGGGAYYVHRRKKA